jgi:late competence protein required for DNA uptake (superfamily II DNA/RNA helicase)
MICKRCLNKKRSVPVETINDFSRFPEYYCVGCKIIRKKEEDEKKWWWIVFAPKAAERAGQKYE